jgi:hypothetical protein
LDSRPGLERTQRRPFALSVGTLRAFGRDPSRFR